MNWAFEKAEGRPAPRRGPVPFIVGAILDRLGSIDRGRFADVGSEESTAIRPRPINPAAASTADHVVLIRATRSNRRTSPARIGIWNMR